VIAEEIIRRLWVTTVIRGVVRGLE